MKAISFLGKGDYVPATYVYGEQECTTHLFPHAVTQFFTPDVLLVCLTPEAKTFVSTKYDETNTLTHFETLCALHQCDNLVPPLPVDFLMGPARRNSGIFL